MGKATVAFDFARDGRFDGTRLWALDVDAAGTPTTGHQWRLAEPLDQTVVRVTSSQREASTTSGVGAPGTTHLEFTPVGPGTATIALEYVRPWERGVAPARSVRISVIVR